MIVGLGDVSYQQLTSMNVNHSVWGNGIRLRIDLVTSAGNPTRYSKQSIG